MSPCFRQLSTDGSSSPSEERETLATSTLCFHKQTHGIFTGGEDIQTAGRQRRILFAGFVACNVLEGLTKPAFEDLQGGNGYMVEQTQACTVFLGHDLVSLTFQLKTNSDCKQFGKVAPTWSESGRAVHEALDR